MPLTLEVTIPLTFRNWRDAALSLLEVYFRYTPELRGFLERDLLPILQLLELAAPADSRELSPGGHSNLRLEPSDDDTVDLGVDLPPRRRSRESWREMIYRGFKPPPVAECRDSICAALGRLNPDTEQGKIELVLR